ncbi:MAG TPA: T9SS type A sorting domain-containing protein, partial [candidate division Zixibacteria bacterium]|nr:T9SS type A sorting domain-containing protein [candidate division Zixibacteria bacterium]
DFFVSNDYTLECSFIPVSFYWTDCTDNSIAFSFKSVLNQFPHCVKQAVSLDIYSPDGSGDLIYEAPFGGFRDITDVDYGFPGYYGAPDDPCYPIEYTDGDAQECEGTAAKSPIRFINFFNGGVKIICNEEIDDRGDVNMNGIPNEIADAVVFTNYFIYGMAAFTISPEGQKAASDVNADGIPLSVADLVYLIRVITGDIMPIPKLSPTVEAHFGHDGQLVTVDVELGAALFVLEGNVDVSLAQGAVHMDLKSGIVNGNTHVLVYSFEKGETFSGNILNTEGKLISVEAADYNGSAYKTIALPTSFSIENYPNPFNSATTISMALPVASNWNLTIYNVAGQKVAEFSGYAEAGINNVVWDSPTAASGIYFYKVTTDSGSMTKKMVLLK